MFEQLVSGGRFACQRGLTIRVNVECSVHVKAIVRLYGRPLLTDSHRNPVYTIQPVVKPV